MDGRLWLFFAISVFFWIFYIPIHRRVGNRNKIRVPKILARLAGSRKEYVDWRSLSFQLGFATFFLWHLLLLRLHVEQFILISGGLTMICILGIQVFIKFLYRGSHLK